MTYEGNCRLGDLFTSRREKGRPGLPTLSVTLNDGLVNREDLDRKQETSLAPEEHLLVKPGDIAYNMMRMWQGAFGLATEEGLVSPAYVVLKPNSRIDPVYASYLLESARFRYLLWAYSHGITDDRLRLYYDDFARIPVSLPAVSVQEKIGKILATWDKAINAAQHLLATSRQQKRAIAKRVFNSRAESKSVVYEQTTIGALVQIHYGRSPIDARQVPGPFPIIGTGGHVGASGLHLVNGPSVILGRKGSISSPQYVESNCWPIDTTFYCLPKSGCDLKWFYHRLTLIDLSQYNEASGVPSLSKATIEAIPIKAPDPTTQHELATLLDAADREIAVIERKRELLLAERSALMQQLLTGKRPVRVSAAEGKAIPS